MKRSTLLLYVIIVLSLLAACVDNNSPQDTSSDEDKIATIVASTLSVIPSPTVQPTQTNMPAPTQTFVPTSVPPESLDRTSIQSVLNWTTYAITENNPEMFSDVIGDNGVEFGGKYATQIAFPGFNNSDLVVSRLQNGLRDAASVCKGYNPDFGGPPDKAHIFFSGIRFEWKNDITGFIFFYLEDGWELVKIVPIPDQAWPNLYQTLWACP